MAQGQGAGIALSSISSLLGYLASTVTASRIDSAGEMLAWKIYPDRTSPITHIDVELDHNGNTLSWTLEIQSDSNDVPSGTTLGSATAAFQVSADGSCGLQALVANTGNLTINTPVWVVLKYSSGGPPDASNYVGIRGASTSGSYISGGMARCRHHNGTNWTTTAVVDYRCGVIVKHLDGTYNGSMIVGGPAVPAAGASARIYSTRREGLKFKIGSIYRCSSIRLYVSKTGNPGDLVMSLYEGSSLKGSVTIPASSIVSATGTPCFFSAPMSLASGVNLYVVLAQASNGGDSSNYYQCRCFPFDNTYRSAMFAPDLEFVYGTGDDPTAYTTVSNEIPLIAPVIFDPALDLDEAAAGGGGFPILSGSLVR